MPLEILNQSELETPGIGPGLPTRLSLGAPVVQVKSIHILQDPIPCITVKVQCCYCFKEHDHDSGGVLTPENIPDDLGHMEPCCRHGSGASISGSVHGYNISTVAWKMSGRTIVQSEVKKAKTSLKVVSDNTPITSYFDRFVAVSKVFLDYRFVEIMKENKALKLGMFWKKYNYEKLKEAMAFANQKAEGPGCSCLACAVSGRKNRNEEEPSDSDQFNCKFKPYFEATLSEFGLLTASGGSESSLGIEHESTGDSEFDVLIHTLVYDIDSHLVTMARNDWYLFTYGAKLWKEGSVESPELQKLSLLFRKLYEFDDEKVEEDIQAD